MLGAGGDNQSSTRDVEAELHSNKSAEAFQAAQISRGTLRTPCWLLLFSFAKPVIFMTPQLLFPAGSCPPLPGENSCCQQQSWGGHPASSKCSCCPAALGMAEETGPFLSARSTEISKHFLSQTELQRRKLGKAWELCFCLTRKGCSGNI